MKIYNAKGMVAGRLAAKIAKELLSGEDIVVIEIQDVILSGTLADHKAKMLSRKSMIDKKDPEKSPKFPKIPRMLFKRMVRGMLPKNSSRGREALKKLKAYEGTPKEINAQDAIVDKTLLKTELRKKITLGKLCSEFGYNEQ
jgi:ribosomal protein uL13